MADINLRLKENYNLQCDQTYNQNLTDICICSRNLTVKASLTNFSKACIFLIVQKISLSLVLHILFSKLPRSFV